MTRETKQFKREGYSFTLNTWLTAQEVRDIENATFDGLKVTEEELKQKLSAELFAKMNQNAENKTIEKYVVSFNDSSENILQRILEAPAKILKDILGEIGALEQDAEAEKKSS